MKNIWNNKERKSANNEINNEEIIIMKINKKKIEIIKK